MVQATGLDKFIGSFTLRRIPDPHMARIGNHGVSPLGT